MWLVSTFIVTVSFLSMEGVAWLTHKYVMHGLLWRLHQDHHRKNPTSFFEKNDYFFFAGLTALNNFGNFFTESA